MKFERIDEATAVPRSKAELVALYKKLKDKKKTTNFNNWYKKYGKLFWQVEKRLKELKKKERQKREAGLFYTILYAEKPFSNVTLSELRKKGIRATRVNMPNPDYDPWTYTSYKLVGPEDALKEVTKGRTKIKPLKAKEVTFAPDTELWYAYVYTQDPISHREDIRTGKDMGLKITGSSEKNGSYYSDSRYKDMKYKIVGPKDKVKEFIEKVWDMPESEWAEHGYYMKPVKGELQESLNADYSPGETLKQIDMFFKDNGFKYAIASLSERDEAIDNNAKIMRKYIKNDNVCFVYSFNSAPHRFYVKADSSDALYTMEAEEFLNNSEGILDDLSKE